MPGTWILSRPFVRFIRHYPRLVDCGSWELVARIGICESEADGVVSQRWRLS
jgi:hypothetical protein